MLQPLIRPVRLVHAGDEEARVVREGQEARGVCGEVELREVDVELDQISSSW